MSISKVPRGAVTRRLALTAAVAGLMASPLLASVSTYANTAAHQHTASADGRTPSMSALYSAIQTLWAQHMEWTYAAVTVAEFPKEFTK